MKPPLRVLIVEDSTDDTELLLRELRRAFVPSWQCVESAEALAVALAQEAWDVLLADYMMPRFTALAALEVLRQSGRDIPFIVVSGSIGEDLAVSAMKAGAHDYLMKNNLTRLNAAIERELREAAGRRERRRAEEALRASEARYRLLFDANPQPLLVCARETLAFLAVNDAAVRHYGYPRERFLTLTLSALQPPEDLPALRAYLAGDAARREQVSAWRHRKKDGGLIDVEMLAHDLVFDDRPALLVQVSDVTERKELEKQLRQAQKMEAVGQLAGGLAHDFNNLLTALLGYGDLMMQKLRPEDPLREDLAGILQVGERASTLTRQLLAFSRKQAMQPRVVDFNALVANMVRLLQRLISADIDLVTQLAPDGCMVTADPGQLEQVLLNLIVNARDAMPMGGKLTVATATVDLDESYARTRPGVRPGPHVRLWVSDTGCGMTEEIKAHLFEPFFTTKEPGKGTGLGLATVYSIVKHSLGQIEVDSEPGRGTRFQVFWPAVREGPSRATGAAAAPRPRGGSETVLLVEDDDVLRPLFSTLLSQEGYRVLAARSGTEALHLGEHHVGPLHMLVTDLVLPQLSGQVVAERLRALRPELKVLYLSGYSGQAVGGEPFLQKPFAPEVLARQVRELLDRGRETPMAQ
jgi:PAS domain S-box-containing protein